MEVVKSILPELSFSTLIPLGLIFFKAGIDTFNMSEVERSVLSDSKKLTIYLSQVSIFTLAFTIIFFGVMVIGNFIAFEVIKLVIGFFVTFILIFALVLIVFILVFSFSYLFSIKINFYIEDGNGEWKIERRIDKKKILVSKDDKIYEFIDADKIMNKEIFSKIANEYKAPFHSFTIKHMSNLKKSALPLFIIAPASIVVIDSCINMNITAKILVLLAFLLICFCSLYIMIVDKNEKIKEKHKSQS